MKRFWNKLTGEERLCRAEQKLAILILDCQDEERRVKLIRRKKEVHLKRLKIRLTLRFLQTSGSSGTGTAPSC